MPIPNDVISTHDRPVRRLERFDPPVGHGRHARPVRSLRQAHAGYRTSQVHAAPAVADSVRASAHRSLGHLGRLGLIGCAVLPTLAAGHRQSPEVASVSAAAALAIVIGVLRWAPGPEAAGADPSGVTNAGGNGGGEVARPVAMTVLALLTAVALELFVLSWGHAGWAMALVGPLATAGIVATYLATFGFRANFLLRRLTLLSLLLWVPVAAATDRVVRSSIDPLSDLVHRRIASIGATGVDEHPWRVFTAMTDRASLVAITAVVMGTAISRRRLTTRSAVEMALAVCVAIVVHHTTILLAPIEQYDRPAWVSFVAGPRYELLLGTGAALLAAWAARRAEARDGRNQNPSVSAARDRDPVLFAVTAADDAPVPVRIAAIALPVLLLTLLIARTVTA